MPDALEEDCAKAAVVVTSRDAPPGCKALTIDRDTVRANGAMELRRNGERFEVTAARPAGEDRPWAHRVARPEPAAAPLRPASRDATPRAEDLEAGD
jgi:competence protein ComEC